VERHSLRLYHLIVSSYQKKGGWMIRDSKLISLRLTPYFTFIGLSSFVFTASEGMTMPPLDTARERTTGIESSASNFSETETRAGCLRRGGLWMNDHPSGLLRHSGCNEPTKDGGKPCADSSGCESACVDDERIPLGGKCYGYRSFFGCGKRVKRGDSVAILCID
jgi:hypothetical protein